MSIPLEVWQISRWYKVIYTTCPAQAEKTLAMPRLGQDNHLRTLFSASELIIILRHDSGFVVLVLYKPTPTSSYSNDSLQQQVRPSITRSTPNDDQEKHRSEQYLIFRATER